MYRLTARALLLVSLLGLLTPWAVGLSGKPAHACCLRKHYGMRPDRAIRSTVPPDGNCCPPASSFNPPELVVDSVGQFVTAMARFNRRVDIFGAAQGLNSLYNPRSPPPAAC